MTGASSSMTSTRIGGRALSFMTTSGGLCVIAGRRFSRGIGVGYRQEQVERRPVTGTFTRGPHAATERVDCSRAPVQADTQVASAAFRGETALEHALEILGRYA